MQIEILNVVVDSKGKYQEAQLAYKDRDGKVQGKKIVSFKFPEVFEILKNAKEGEKYEIKPIKEGNFWNWAEAVKFEASQTAVVSKATPKSTYETPEERAVKQIYIVRQSSISNAIDYYKLTEAKKVKPDDIIALAKEFEAYVFNSQSDKTDGGLSEMDDDIPF